MGVQAASDMLMVLFWPASKVDIETSTLAATKVPSQYV